MFTKGQNAIFNWFPNKLLISLGYGGEEKFSGQ